jgi:hypothetical protein
VLWLKDTLPVLRDADRGEHRNEQRLALLRKRLEQAYVDRLDGKITEEFWEAKSAEWQEEEQALLASLRELEQAENPERRSTAFAF